MKMIVPLAALVLTLGCEDKKPAATTGGTAPADVHAELQTCGACHKPDENDLSSLSRADLVSRLRAIREGKAEHPTKLDKFNDSQLEEMAASLAGK